jgi:hypothetical protein
MQALAKERSRSLRTSHSWTNLWLLRKYGTLGSIANLALNGVIMARNGGLAGPFHFSIILITNVLCTHHSNGIP